jgi:cyclopropane-fatty-acyl-phospholipid synthase
MTAIADPYCLGSNDDRACLRTAVARQVTKRVVRNMPVRIEFPDGSVMGAGTTNQDPVIEVTRPNAFFRRLGHQPKIGFGEAYMAGDWRASEGTDLGAALYPIAAHITNAVPKLLQRIRTLVEERVPQSQRNTPMGSRKNIKAHYDLSNALFESFLDDSLTYSSALFSDSSPWSDQSLESAQLRKVDSALDRAGVAKGTRLLEIGTGWGTLAIQAAKRGAYVTSLTLSQEQTELALKRAAEAGVADRVKVVLQDYREASGAYDSIVSVEMIEAVGEEFWSKYFSAVSDLLIPGGKAVVQSILMSHDRYLETRRSFSWIQKHIFPGGIIPSVRVIQETVAATDLLVTDQLHFGLHYAETLRRWRASFIDAWPEIEALGFDKQFRLMWEFYLGYSESGFESGYLDVAQFTFTKSGGALDV